MTLDYTAYDAVGLAELVRKREVTPAELLETAIARADALIPSSMPSFRVSTNARGCG
jgi:Asp-tRNA(Asn)/Glu-tRNA(Gln) amidotransferase A subunit family amidase